MNFQCNPVFTPIRVLMVNPLSCAAQLTITKFMTGVVFGKDQLIDLILLVYANERDAANDLKLELYSCGFYCMNSITVTTDLPVISDADVFCFITNFHNPNSVDFNELDNREFDDLYLIIKIANSLCQTKQDIDEGKDDIFKKKHEKKLTCKPIIIADGIVTINIIKYVAKDLPNDIFFCPTPLPSIGQKVLAEELKIPAFRINCVQAWAANDAVFHIEVMKPLIVGDVVVTETHCDWEGIGKGQMKDAVLDNTQFNETWLKKDFIDKVHILASRNPYGSISRAAGVASVLTLIWKPRAANAKKDLKVYTSAGVISDGSMDTIKGFAYVFPLELTGDTWKVDRRFAERFHVMRQLQKINKKVKELKETLMYFARKSRVHKTATTYEAAMLWPKLYPFCKRFLQENVINQAFIPACSDSVLAILK